MLWLVSMPLYNYIYTPMKYIHIPLKLSLSPSRITSMPLHNYICAPTIFYPCPSIITFVPQLSSVYTHSTLATKWRQDNSMSTLFYLTRKSTMYWPHWMDGASTERANWTDGQAGDLSSMTTLKKQRQETWNWNQYWTTWIQNKDYNLTEERY